MLYCTTGPTARIRANSGGHLSPSSATRPDRLSEVVGGSYSSAVDNTEISSVRSQSCCRIHLQRRGDTESFSNLNVYVELLTPMRAKPNQRKLQYNVLSDCASQLLMYDNIHNRPSTGRQYVINIEAEILPQICRVTRLDICQSQDIDCMDTRYQGHEAHPNGLARRG